MKHVGDHSELKTNEARQGETSGSVRYVLGVGLFLAVIAGFIVYFFH
jgi:hypothetical protein